jgi:predicted dehydrogenase
MGTKGEVVADMSEKTIKVTPFGKETEVIDVSKLATDFSGHAGGDNRMVEEFIDMIAEGKEPTNKITSVERSVESHYCAMAAEKSRLADGAVIDLDTLRK